MMDNLPEEWQDGRLKDFCVRITDGSHFSPKTVEDGLPYVTVKDVSDKGDIDLIGCKKITKDDFENLEKGNCRPNIGDVLLSKDGTVGKTAIVNKNNNFVLLSSLAILTPFDDLDSRFLYHFLNSPSFQDTAIKSKTGAAIKRIVLKTIKEFKIPLPPFPEQKRIVTKLDVLFERIDKSITLLEENIQHTQNLMASVLEEVFMDLRDSSTVYKIGTIAEVKGGKRLPKGNKVLDEKTKYPYIRVTDFLDSGTINTATLKYINKKVYEQISRYIINNDDLYISIAGTIGKTGIIPIELNGANLTENAARIVYKPDYEIVNQYFYYFTLSDNFKEQIGSATKAVAQPKLALTRLKEVEIPLPDKETQELAVLRFDKISSKTTNIIAEQQSKLNNLKGLKASILDTAFKGEL
jgi:type I restriction enzyme, S subunit